MNLSSSWRRRSVCSSLSAGRWVTWKTITAFYQHHASLSLLFVSLERERGQETGDRSGAIPLMPLNNWCCHHVTLSNNFILFSSNPRHNFRKKVSIVIDCIDSSFWEIDVKILISPFRPFRSHDCLCLMQEKIFNLFLSDLFDWLIILVFNHR